MNVVVWHGHGRVSACLGVSGFSMARPGLAVSARCVPVRRWFSLARQRQGSHGADWSGPAAPGKEVHVVAVVEWFGLVRNGEARQSWLVRSRRCGAGFGKARLGSPGSE